MLDSEMKLKEEAYPIPEDEYDRFKYKLEEKSNVFAERNLIKSGVTLMNNLKNGDVCMYSYDNDNKSNAIVEIIDILNSERGIAKVKFLFINSCSFWLVKIKSSQKCG